MRTKYKMEAGFKVTEDDMVERSWTVSGFFSLLCQSRKISKGHCFYGQQCKAGRLRTWSRVETSRDGQNTGNTASRRLGRAPNSTFIMLNLTKWNVRGRLHFILSTRHKELLWYGSYVYLLLSWMLQRIWAFCSLRLGKPQKKNQTTPFCLVFLINVGV